MVKIGVCGPVGSGKTALIEALTRHMSKDFDMWRVKASIKAVLPLPTGPQTPIFTIKFLSI
ncbi:hypothetical protein TH0274_04220 [Helicobacter pylori]